jgi:hypothetical protein
LIAVPIGSGRSANEAGAEGGWGALTGASGRRHATPLKTQAQSAPSKAVRERSGFIPNHGLKLPRVGTKKEGRLIGFQRSAISLQQGKRLRLKKLMAQSRKLTADR